MGCAQRIGPGSQDRVIWRRIGEMLSSARPLVGNQTLGYQEIESEGRLIYQSPIKACDHDDDHMEGKAHA
jgi:hypothetical protein